MVELLRHGFQLPGGALHWHARGRQTIGHMGCCQAENLDRSNNASPDAPGQAKSQHQDGESPQPTLGECSIRIGKHLGRRHTGQHAPARVLHGGKGKEARNPIDADDLLNAFRGVNGQRAHGFRHLPPHPCSRVLRAQHNASRPVDHQHQCARRHRTQDALPQLLQIHGQADQACRAVLCIPDGIEQHGNPAP